MGWGMHPQSQTIKAAGFFLALQQASQTKVFFAASLGPFNQGLLKCGKITH